MEVITNPSPHKAEGTVMLRSFSLFSQILHLFSRHEFQHTVHELHVERYSKGFSCWDQFVAMFFCQLGQAHSRARSAAA